MFSRIVVLQLTAESIMSIRTASICIAITIALSSAPSVCFDVKTVSAKRLGVYLHNDSTVFLQRFHFPANTRLDSISLKVAGKTVGHIGKVVILGHEGGTMVPSINSQVLATYNLTKDSIGIQEVTIETDYAHIGGQLFIGVLDLKGDVRLLTDRSVRDTMCWDYGVPWNDQLRVTSDSYHVLPFAFKVVCHSSANPVDRGSFQSDSLIDQLESDAFLGSRSNIIVEDLDNDGMVDILSRGVAQLRGSSGWTALAVSSVPAYHAACNLYGDDQIEFVTIEKLGDGVTIKVQQLLRFDKGSTSVAQLNQLKSYGVDHFGVPKAHFISDINHDQHEDLILVGDRTHIVWGGVVGQSGSTDQLPMGIANVTSAVALPPGCSRADGMVRTSEGELFEIEYQDGHWNSVPVGTIEAVETPDASLDLAIVGGQNVVVAAQWHPAKVQLEGLEKKHGTNVLLATSGSLGTSAGARVVTEPVVFNEHVTAIAYADLDADGVDEVVVSTGNDCHFLRVYSVESGIYRDITMDIGLFGIDNVDDFLLCDINGDLAPDLCVSRRGRFDVYNNHMKQHGNRVKVKARWAGGLSNTQINMHQSHKVVSTIARSAHGSGMQQPQDPTVVLNSQYDSDSVVIVWPDGQRETFMPRTDMDYQRGNGHLSDSASNKIRLYGSNLKSASLDVPEPLDHAVFSLVTMEGKTIAFSAPLTVQRGSIQLADALPLDNTTAAGMYVVMVHREGVLILQQRFIHIP
jgi:hypothetical protein